MSNVRISLRLAPELREEIARAAAEERRTPSNLLRNVLSDWLAGRKTLAEFHEERAA